MSTDRRTIVILVAAGIGVLWISHLSEDTWLRLGALVPAVIALLAVLIRLPHLGWGLPEVEEEALPMKKALDMWDWASGHVRLDPRTAGWPSLSFYVHLLLQHLHYGWGRLTGAFADRNDYLVASWLDMGPVLLLARLLSVAAAGAIVWVTARLAERLAGRAGAWLAGGLLALSPLLVEYAQLVTPDILLALFAALAVSRIVEIARRGSVADDVWAGVWIGLGISCKYTPALLLPAVFIAHAVRARERGRPVGATLRAPGPWLATLAAGIAFAVTSPYLLLAPSRLARDVAAQTLHMTSGHFGQTPATSSLLHYLTGVLAPAFGAPGLAVALGGLVWAAARLGGSWWVIAACVAPYYLGLAALRTQFPRYMLPLLMPLALGLAAWAPALRSLPWFKVRRRRAVALGLVALLAWAPAALGTWRQQAEKSRPSAQQLANRFLAAAAANGTRHVAAEVLSLSLPTARAAQDFADEVSAALSPAQRSRVLRRKVYDVDFIPMYTVQPEASAFYYDLRHYLAYDDIVVSQAVRDRYLADPSSFQTQTAFYRDLERYATRVRRFGAAEGARGPEILFYHLAPDSAAALLRARGEIALDPAAIAAGPVHLPDFLPFVEGVARAALAKGRWEMAARYYQLLLGVAERGGMSGDQRAALMRMVAELRSRAAIAKP